MYPTLPWDEYSGKENDYSMVTELGALALSEARKDK
jgi:hypothetical protein